MPKRKKKNQLWERQEWDTKGSFKYFHEFYLSQKAPRSLNKAYRMARAKKGIEEASNKTAPGAWKHWFAGKDYRGKAIKGKGKVVGWMERALAFDDSLARQDTKEWAKARKKIREDDYETGEALRAVADEILEHGPNYIKENRRFVKGTKGQPDQLIITLALGVGDAVRAAEAGSKMQRMAAEMDTDRKRTSNYHVDFSTLTNEQLERIANGEDPLDVVSTPS